MQTCFNDADCATHMPCGRKYGAADPSQCLGDTTMTASSVMTIEFRPGSRLVASFSESDGSATPVLFLWVLWRACADARYHRCER